MKYQLIALVLLIGLSFASCKSDDDSLPTCIDVKIEEFSAGIICGGEDANVKSYTFQEQLVYVFSAVNACVDGTADVVTEECDELGYLGGLIGNTEINGVNFYDEAIFIEVVWTN